MKLVIELGEEDVKKLILAELQRRLGEVSLDIKNVKIETKSKQNYKSEWETANYRVNYEGNI